MILKQKKPTLLEKEKDACLKGKPEVKWTQIREAVEIYRKRMVGKIDHRDEAI